MITYTNNFGCTKTATVIVNALPSITGSFSVCLGFTTQLVGSATAATTTPWVSATPAFATVSSTGLVKGISGGMSVMTYTNSLGCKTSATVTVNALPVITGTLKVCLGSTVQLTGSGTAAVTNPWISATPIIASVSKTGLVTGIAPGTSIITYTTIEGCKKTAIITVSTLPTTNTAITVCMGTTTLITAATTTPWISAGTAFATISSAGLITWVTAGTNVYSYTNNEGCTNTLTFIVDPVPTITGPLTVCTGSTIQLTGSAEAATTTPWVSATPKVATVSSTGLIKGISAGTSVITYTTFAGCKATTTVAVNTTPTISGTLSVCSGSFTQLTGSATAATTNPWISANPDVATVSNKGLVMGIAAGTSVITYTNSKGCTKIATVTVNALPAIAGTLTVCGGFTSQLTGSVTAATTTPWISATTAVATISSTGLVTGVTEGTSVITYTNSLGCKTTASVTANAAPTITGTLAVCAGSATQLIGSVTAAVTSPWKSASPAIATVSDAGLVTGVV
jgi:uncharacterized protein YjdB